MSQPNTDSSITRESEPRTRSRKKTSSPLKPDKDAPEEAEKKVRSIIKLKYPDYDKAAAALAPVFGLGSDLLAGQRAQGLFRYKPFFQPFAEFADSCLEGRWDVPVASWDIVLQILRARENEDGAGKARVVSSPDPDPVPDKSQWTVNEHYAHFIRQVMQAIRSPIVSKSMVYWIAAASTEDAYWVLFHGLMYLHLDAMRENRRHAPIKDRINYMLKRSQGMQ